MYIRFDPHMHNGQETLFELVDRMGSYIYTRLSNTDERKHIYLIISKFIQEYMP